MTVWQELENENCYAVGELTIYLFSLTIKNNKQIISDLPPAKGDKYKHSFVSHVFDNMPNFKSQSMLATPKCSFIYLIIC